MNGDERRNAIICFLSGAQSPVSASKLAKMYNVSRQCIVQDIALLRANGVLIDSLARGYQLPKATSYKRVFKVIHSDEDVERELSLIVDSGGVVDDVFVFHKVYGKVHAAMDIRSKVNVRQFLEDIAAGKSSLLKNVTAGYHYHTVSADSIQTLDLIEETLKKEGFLAPLQPYEPEEISNKS